MKIAKPLLAITTPIGVAIGLREAGRFHWWLAMLMGVLLSVIAAFLLVTLRTIRKEARSQPRPPGDLP